MNIVYIIITYLFTIVFLLENIGPTRHAYDTVDTRYNQACIVAVYRMNYR